jgi:hypothetical protein
MFLAAIRRITRNSAYLGEADWQMFEQHRPAMTIHEAEYLTRRHARVANESLEVIA